MPQMDFIKSYRMNRVLLLVLSALVVHNEFLCYKIASRQWSHFPTSPRDFVRILFVADPQLLGVNEQPPLIGPLVIWDSDRYLAKGFQEASDHVRPDVVVFLGDLFDEGGISSDAQYESYMRRFEAMFKFRPGTEKVFIPGDNDLAREPTNNIDPRMKERFRRHFPSFSDPIVSVKFLDILKFNDFGANMYDTIFDLSAVSNTSGGTIRILCGHLRVFDVPRNMSDLQPNLIVTGHGHKSAYVTCTGCRDRDRRLQDRPFHEGNGASLSSNLSLDLDLRLEQILVPTCSYRMGVPHPGYGYMSLDSAGQMNYTVLWLPGRLPMLYSYALFGTLLTSVALLRVTCTRKGSSCCRLKSRWIMARPPTRFRR